MTGWLLSGLTDRCGLRLLASSVMRERDRERSCTFYDKVNHESNHDCTLEGQPRIIINHE